MKRLNLLYLAGVLVIAIGFFASPTPGWAAYLDHQTPDITAGGLNQPAKVAVDSANGDVYVTDAGNKMVKKFDKNGNYLSGFSVSGTPVGIAVTASNILVGDSTSHCVWIFNKSGALTDLYYTGTTHKIDGLGTHGAISMPNTVAVAPAGHIFVLDGDNDKGYIYSSGGKYLASFGIGGSGGATTNIQFYNPSGIAFGTAVANSPSTGLTTQNFFVGDQGNSRVLKLSYVYNTTQLFISANSITLPASSPTFGTKGDAFNKFLRVSDLAWDNNNRLIVLDSLQQVGQVFNSTGGTLGIAANYSGSAVLNQLNIPTGAAVDMTGHKLYVANNQAGSLSVYTTTDGALPSIVVTAPAQGSTTTPCTINYAVNFNGTVTGSSATVKLYYAKTKDAQGNNISNPAYTLFSTQTPTVTSGNYSGTATLDLVGTFPNFMWAGTYNIYAEVYDSSMNSATYNAGNIAITLVAGKRRYTCSMQARFGTFDLAQDSDNDGINDFDEIEGTYNAAYNYAPTDPMNADSDHDGLDDGVEELQRTLANNISMPLTGGLLAAATNPNNPDTDGGGVSDGVEVAKGTNPVSGADDLSSTQDLVADYFLDATHGADTIQNQDTWFDITNPTASTMVVDLAFYNLNGAIASGGKIPAAYYLAPMQTVRFYPKKDFGFNEGSLEIRANTASIKADLVRYRENAIDPNSLDSGGAINLWRPADQANRLMCAQYNDGASRWNGWVYVKNWSDTTANVTVKFYDWSDPSQHMDTSLVVGGHETKVLRPTSVYGDTPDAGGHASFGSAAHYSRGYMLVTSDRSTITSNAYIDRMNANYYSSGNTGYMTWDFGYVYPLVKDIGTTSYCTLMNTEINRWFTWLYIANPDDTTTMNATLKFYNKLGNLVLTSPVTVAPHEGKAIRSSTGLTVGAPTTGSPNLFDFGEVLVTSDIPHVFTMVTERYNPDNVTFDYGFVANNLLASSITSTPFATSYIDNSIVQQTGTPTSSFDQRLLDWVYLCNFSDTLTSNVNVTYYSTSGSPWWKGSIGSGTNTVTVSGGPITGGAINPFAVGKSISIAGVTGSKAITAVNGSVLTLDSNADATVSNAAVALVKTVGPHMINSALPNFFDNAPVQGVIKFVSDNPITGLHIGQEWNYSCTTSGGTFFDYGFVKPYWPAP